MKSIGSWAALGVAVLGVACGGQTGSSGTKDGGVGGNGGGGTGGTGLVGGTGGTGLVAGTGGTGLVGGTGGTAGGTNVGQPPPPDPNAPPASGAAPTTFGVRWMSMGDIDRNGVPDSTAWKQFGFNVDGLVSDKLQTNHCKAQEGGTKSAIQTDGENGIDNSFGSNIMPIIGSLAPNPSKSINDSITAGEFTLIFHMANLGPEPSQNGVTSAYYVGSGTFTPPKWDGTDNWPVTAESLTNPGDINSSKTPFPASYVVNGFWVSAPQVTPNPLFLTLGVQGFPLPLAVHFPRVGMQLSGTGPQAKGALGQIGGVLETEELIAELKKVAGSFDTNLCEGATFDSIAQQIRAASDVMKDGTNGDPTKTCDGISIGVGFEANALVLGNVAPPVQAQPDPCAGA